MSCSSSCPQSPVLSPGSTFMNLSKDRQPHDPPPAGSHEEETKVRCKFTSKNYFEKSCTTFLNPFDKEPKGSYVPKTEKNLSFFFFFAFTMYLYFIFYFILLFYLFVVFLGPHPRYMEVPRLGVESELQLPAYTTATATHSCFVLFFPL